MEFWKKQKSVLWSCTRNIKLFHSAIAILTWLWVGPPWPRSTDSSFCHFWGEGSVSSKFCIKYPKHSVILYFQWHYLYIISYFSCLLPQPPPKKWLKLLAKPGRRCAPQFLHSPPSHPRITHHGHIWHCSQRPEDIGPMSIETLLSQIGGAYDMVIQIFYTKI